MGWFLKNGFNTIFLKILILECLPEFTLKTHTQHFAWLQQFSTRLKTNRSTDYLCRVYMSCNNDVFFLLGIPWKWNQTRRFEIIKKWWNWYSNFITHNESHLIIRWFYQLILDIISVKVAKVEYQIFIFRRCVKLVWIF